MRTLQAAWLVSIATIVALGACSSKLDAQALPPGWTAHYREGVLFVPHPRGWLVQEQADGAFLVYLPGDGGTARALVLVQPQRFTAERNAADALGYLPRDYAAMFPKARVISGDALAPPYTGVRGQFEFSVGDKTYRGVALVLQSGSVGGLYVMSAETDAWDATAESMALILNGYRYLTTQASASPTSAAPPVQWARWRDPREDAFTVPVPQGWSVQGGLARPNVIEWRPEVTVMSPDQTMQIRIGDGGLQQFTEPGSLPFIPAPQPGTAPTAYGGEYSPYLPGAQFLLQYFIPRRIGNIGGAQAYDLPDMAQRNFAQFPPPPTAQGRADSGVLRFELGSAGQPLIGQFYATTLYHTPPAGVSAMSTWRVVELWGYVCRPDREALAQSILREMVRGFEWNVPWYARQVQIDIGQAQQIIAGSAELSQMAWESQRRYAEGMERAQAPLTQAAAGLTEYRDDQGNTYRVPITGAQNYYLVQRTGEVLATDRSDLPAYDFTQLYRSP